LIVAQSLQAFKLKISTLQLPLVVLLEQQGAHEPRNGGLVGALARITSLAASGRMAGDVKSLRQAKRLLDPGITLRQLEAEAAAMGDNDAAHCLSNNTGAMFSNSVFNRSSKAA